MAGLGIAGYGDQGLCSITAGVGHGHSGAELLAPRMHGQLGDTIGSPCHCQFGLYHDPWHARSQAQIALQRFAAQWALGLNARQQLLQILIGRSNIAFHVVITYVTFDQHHVDPAIGHILRRQVGIRQQVALLPVALGQALGVLLQFTQRGFAPDQRLIVFAQVAQGEHRAALEAHFLQHQPGVGRGPVGVVDSRPCQPYAGAHRGVVRHRQVGAGQTPLVFMAVEKPRQRVGVGSKCPKQQHQGHDQRTHRALHVPMGCGAPAGHTRHLQA